MCIYEYVKYCGGNKVRMTVTVNAPKYLVVFVLFSR